MFSPTKGGVQKYNPDSGLYERVEEQTVEAVPSPSLGYSSIETQIKFLQGKVLTVIDASFPQGNQLKAVKDLVNEKFREQLNWISELCYSRLSGLKVKSALDSGGCQCEECVITPHKSSCAVHNEPAFPKGECNCK